MGQWLLGENEDDKDTKTAIILVPVLPLTISPVWLKQQMFPSTEPMIRFPMKQLGMEKNVVFLEYIYRTIPVS